MTRGYTSASFKLNPELPATQTDLSDGALADLRGHRLKLRICGQIEFVVPQELKETGTEITVDFFRIRISSIGQVCEHTQPRFQKSSDAV